MLQLIEEIRSTQRILDGAERIANPIREHLEDLREELHALMRNAGVKTVEGSGLQAVRSTRRAAIVTDETALREHIAAEGRMPDYMKLDLIAARKDGVKRGWPGVEQTSTDVLSIRSMDLLVLAPASDKGAANG